MNTNEVSPLVPPQLESNDADPTPSEYRKATIRFLVVGFLGLITFAYSPEKINLLIFYFLTSLIALRLFISHVIHRFSRGELSAKKAVWFTSIGLERASLWLIFFQILNIFLFFAVALMYIKSSTPRWLQDLQVSINNFGCHGDIVDVKSRLSHDVIILSRLYNASNKFNRFWRPKLLRSGMTLLSNSLVVSRSPYQSKTEFEVPPMIFEDGTNALPLLSDLFLALSRIPLSVLLFFAFMNAFVVRALPREAVKRYFSRKFTTQLRSSIQSIVASAAAIGLGMCIFDWVLVNLHSGGIISAFEFWLDAAMQIFTGALIGITMHKNSETLYTDEKKEVLLEPVLYRGLYNVYGSLIWIAFLKLACPVLAKLCMQGSGDAADLTPLIPFAGFGFIMTICSIGTVIFVTRKAINSYRENSQLI